MRDRKKPVYFGQEGIILSTREIARHDSADHPALGSRQPSLPLCPLRHDGVILVDDVVEEELVEVAVAAGQEEAAQVGGGLEQGGEGDALRLK